GLITIYEQERDWSRAIGITRRLEKARGYALRPVIAQYYCELAEQARESGTRNELRQYLKQARAAYKDCVRASLLRGALAEQDHDPRLAIRIYRQVIKQDPEFASEVIEPLRRCYSGLHDLRGYAADLQYMMAASDTAHAHVAYARLLHEQGRTDEGIAHLSRYLHEQANWIGFNQLLNLTRARTHGGLTGPLDSLRQSLNHIVERQAIYHCGHCGFSGRYLHWQCPSCRQWNSMVPLRDIQPQPRL